MATREKSSSLRARKPVRMTIIDMRARTASKRIKEEAATLILCFAVRINEPPPRDLDFATQHYFLGAGLGGAGVCSEPRPL